MIERASDQPTLLASRLCHGRGPKPWVNFFQEHGYWLRYLSILGTGFDTLPEIIVHDTSCFVTAAGAGRPHCPLEGLLAVSVLLASFSRCLPARSGLPVTCLPGLLPGEGLLAFAWLAQAKNFTTSVISRSSCSTTPRGGGGGGKKRTGVFLLVLGGALSPGLLGLLLSPGPVARVVAVQEGPS